MVTQTKPEREAHMLPSIARPGESFHEFETKAKIRTEVHLDSLKS